MTAQRANTESSKQEVRYLGIDLGGTSVKFGRVTELGVIESQSKSATVSERGRDALMGQLGDIGETLLSEARKFGYEPPYLGIVTPGAIDAERGRVIGGSPNIPGWVGAEIATTLEKRLGIAVLVENDARGMALAEFRFGAGRDVASVLCVTIGTGIGGAIIINNQLWRGHSQSAGEIGHTIIDVDDSLTSQASQGEPLAGTLENLTSARAIERRMQRILAEHGSSEIIDRILSEAGRVAVEKLSARHIFDAYHLGDKFAVDCLKETGEILGRGLAGIVNLLNPEMVIIGGGVADAVPDIVAQVADKIKTTALVSATSDLKVMHAELGNSAGLIGAALLGQEPFWQELLERK